MAKLLRNLALLLLPVVAYYVLFVVYEPNNYFGLKERAEGTDIMAVLRQYEERPQNRIILGDSRTAKFDMALVQRAAGASYANLSYGGAALKEQLDLLDWALAQNPNLEEVVFALSFYTLNSNYNQDRMVLNALNNPLAYMTNLGYNINMLTNLYDHISPGRAVGNAGQTMDPADYVYVPFTQPATGQTVQMRETMATHLNGLVGRSQSWTLNEKQLQRLLDAVAECEERGIRFVLVLPPASAEVMDYIVKPYGIDVPMQAVLARLWESGALVLDYEFEGQGLLRDDQFYDGFHLDSERGQPQWTEMLFGQLKDAREAADAA